MAKPESVSLVTRKFTAIRVIQESGLVLEGYGMTLIRVGTKLRTEETMEAGTSLPWDISWFSDKELNFPCSPHLVRP